MVKEKEDSLGSGEGRTPRGVSIGLAVPKLDAVERDVSSCELSGERALGRSALAGFLYGRAPLTRGSSA